MDRELPSGTAEVILEFYFYCLMCREEYDSDGEMYRCPECLWSDYDDIDVGEDDGPISNA